jgi:uncharacterized protein (DUF427 family)
MPTASWNGVVIAQASDDQVEIVENNVYFPPSSVKREYLQPSAHTSRCPWKGLASYYSVSVNGKVNENAAWYYPEPSEKAAQIKDHVAFWPSPICNGSRRSSAIISTSSAIPTMCRRYAGWRRSAFTRT